MWLPTQLRELDGEESRRCNLAGCENCRISDRARDAISNPDPALLRDHWLSQDITLRRELGKLHGVAPEQIFLTSGAMGAIRYAFELFTSAGTHVGLLKPDWFGFRFFAEHARTKISYLEQLTPPFCFRASDLIHSIGQEKIEFVILSSPSAATGILWESDTIEELLIACPDTFFVIDEADTVYPHLSSAQLVNRYSNVMFLQSFSKLYGLSGLRIGYLVTPAAYTDDFERTINPIELTSLSILAARAALSDTEFLQETQNTVQKNLLAVTEALKGTPFRLIEPSRCFAAYLWSDDDSQDPFHFLAALNIDIVPGEPFGLKRGGRINLSNPVAIQTLISTLATSIPAAVP